MDLWSTVILAFWKYGKPDNHKDRETDVWQAGLPYFRFSVLLVCWIYGLPFYRITGLPERWKNGLLDLCFSGLLEVW